MPITVFAGGQVGQWRVEGIEPVTGPSLPTVSRLATSDGAHPDDSGAAWTLRGGTSNARYTRRNEQQSLAAQQAGLGRPQATRAALIPITKSEAWWALPQDERRELFEETSHHTAIGLEYLPAIARRLYHGRDLDEPFDFLTWFEYAPRTLPRSRTGGPPARHPGVGLRGTRGRHPPRALSRPFCLTRGALRGLGGHP